MELLLYKKSNFSTLTFDTPDDTKVRCRRTKNKHWAIYGDSVGWCTKLAADWLQTEPPFEGVLISGYIFDFSVVNGCSEM